MDKPAGYIVYKDGKVVDWKVSEEFMEELHAAGFEDITAEQVLEILLKHKSEAEITDGSGNVIRPKESIIN